MSLQSARDDIAKGLHELDRILASEGSVVTVVKGMNIASLIETNPPNTIYRCDPDYIYSGPDFDINKPCQIMNRDISLLPKMRVNNSFIGPIIRCQLGIKAPQIKFGGIRIEGTNKDIKLILTDYNGLDTRELTFDRCVVLGSNEGQWCGISVYGEYFTIMQSHVGNCWYQGRDSQAIASERGMKHAVLDDTFLEGSGENFMLGGWELLDESFIPEDILINNCHFFKPLSWKSKPGSVKNLFEIKAGKNIRVKNSLFENNWVDAQAGMSILLNVRNQNGNDPYATIRDIVFDNNVVRNVAGGVSLLGRDDTHPSVHMKDVMFNKLRIEGLSFLTNGGNGRTFQILGGPENLTLQGIDVQRMPGVTTQDPVNSFMMFDPEGPKTVNLVVKSSSFVEGEYGIHGGSLGTPALDYCAPGYTWEGNAVKLSGYRTIPYPPGTTLIP